MIQKLAKLGRLVPEDEYPENPLGLNYDYDVEAIVLIGFNFKEETESWEFDEVAVERYQNHKIDSYLYKSAKGRATSEFPTIDVYKRDDLMDGDQVSFEQSKAGRKLVYILEKYNGAFDSLVALLKSDEALKQELAEKTKDLSRFALSVRLDGELPGESKWIAPKIELLMNRQGRKDFYTYKGKKYQQKNKLCSITGEVEDTIWGYVVPKKEYKFYAVKTELGAVPGGFNAKEAWKNFPVSPKGAKLLERGAKFMEEHLRFRFCGYNYYLIPELILRDDQPDEVYLEMFKEFKRPKSSGKQEVNRDLEEDLLEMLGKEKKKNSANYTLFFYEINNAEFKILSVVEDVFPSQFRKLYDAKRKAEDHDLFKAHKIYGKMDDFRFTFSDLKIFFPQEKSFLAYVRSIFMQKPIKYQRLLQAVMEVIRSDFANGEIIKQKTLRSYLLLKFLAKLSLIKYKTNNEAYPMEKKDEYEEFFSKHSEFFNDAVRKAVFLEGLLAQKLINQQYHLLNGSKPFKNRLNSLRINKKIVQRILPEMIDKFDKYENKPTAVRYKNLERLTGQYLIQAEPYLDDYSDVELSFFFTVGMSSDHKFKKDSNTKRKTTENEN